MSKIQGYIKKEDRKRLLLLCDDIRVHSGIATMAREIVVKSSHHYNWLNLGAALKHPEIGKKIDLSADINKQLNIDDAEVHIIPSNGYGDASTIRRLIRDNDIDGIVIFTDPRYWVWLFQIEREIRSEMPIMWYNIWDDYPAPLYNKDYYNSVDTLMAISKQTKNINELVLEEDAKNKIIKYIPHGIDENTFFPLDVNQKEFKTFRNQTLKGRNLDFLLFFNSRNIHRKHPHDLILAYRIFCDKIGEEAAKKCGLIMHTQPVDQNGTDLNAIKEAFCDPSYVNVMFSTSRLSAAQLNSLYNMADATVLPSSNEGWGLSVTESMLAGTMTIATVTGGMQDQMRFEDENGEWINFSAEFPSNHRGTYKKHGNWTVPVFPSNISLQGSVKTPYIFDDRIDPEELAEAMLKVYNTPKSKRKEYGLEGREWALSDEAGFTASKMTESITQAIDETFDKWQPRKPYDLIKIEDIKPKYVKHAITGY